MNYKKHTSSSKRLNNLLKPSFFNCEKREQGKNRPVKNGNHLFFNHANKNRNICVRTEKMKNPNFANLSQEKEYE